MTNERLLFNKNILVAVDESESGRRAVSYVGQILGGMTGFKIIILNVIHEPDEDYFQESLEKEAWLAQHKLKADAMLNDHRQLLIKEGFEPNNIVVRSIILDCPSIADCILTEREKMGCSTIVVGRKGVSRKEEFLFGSVSNKIIHHAHDCTVWVVE